MGFFEDLKGTVTATLVGTAGVPGTVIGELAGHDEVNFSAIPQIYHNAWDLGAKGGFETEDGRKQTLGDFPDHLKDHYRDTPFVGDLAGGLVDITRGGLSLAEGAADGAGGLLSAGGGLADGLGTAAGGIGAAGRAFEELPSIITILVVVVAAVAVIAVLAKTGVVGKAARAVKA